MVESTDPLSPLVTVTVQGCSPKKWGTPETDLDKDFLNNLVLHTRTLIHVRKILLY